MPDPLSYSDVRTHLKDVLDSAERAQSAVVKRGSGSVAITDAGRLRRYFAGTTAPRLRIAYDDGAWIASMDGRPFVSEGATLDDAIDDLVVSLREYAEDWADHLSAVPNHRDEWALVQLLLLSDDAQLREWLRSEGDRGAAAGADALSAARA